MARMRNSFRICLLLCVCLGLCRIARADIINVSLDTSPLIGHPAGPFYFVLTFTDGSGVGDANNTLTISGVDFGGGSALGGVINFGSATGSLESTVSVTDSSVLSFFSEAFAPGLRLGFSLDLTTSDDAGGTPDAFALFLYDNSGVPIPTMAPFGDYFLAGCLGSAGAALTAYGSDPSRAPTVGDPISMAAPTVTAVPEPASIDLFVGVLVAMIISRRRFPSSGRR